MIRPRLIPCLLIHKGGLVKTRRFSEPKYIGDPINAVRIFNEKEVDELMVLDIDASSKDKEPNYNLIEKLASECRMPFCYGGGIKTIDQAKKIFSLGVEKVALSSSAIKNPKLISEISKLHEDVLKWIEIVLKPKSEEIISCLKNSNDSLGRNLEKSEMILSPSDFGFHNIIERKKKLFFIIIYET